MEKGVRTWELACHPAPGHLSCDPAIYQRYEKKGRGRALQTCSRPQGRRNTRGYKTRNPLQSRLEDTCETCLAGSPSASSLPADRRGGPQDPRGLCLSYTARQGGG